MTNKEIGQVEEELSKIEKMKRGHVQHQICNFIKDRFILSIGVVITIIIGVVILLCCCWISVDTMTLKEIKEHRQKLVDIQKMPDEKERMEALKGLAKAIGAGTVHTKIVGSTTEKTSNGGTVTHIRQNPISESELIQNINDSLQTATMVDMCRVSGNNYIVSIVAALAAFFSALAAWATIYYTRK